jgi:prolyl 4-hydroxylase
MLTNCAPSCKSCHMIDVHIRCPPLDDQPAALHPGGLNKMFERIVRTAPGNRTLSEAERKDMAEQGMPEYTVQVISRPSDSPASEISAVLDKSLPPWAIIIDNFMTDKECDEMVRLGHVEGYKRSEDVGAMKFDGSHDSFQNDRRTSENAWCSHKEGCRDKEVPTRLHDRIAHLTGIPAVNSEDFQILKYEHNQYYK